MKKKDIQYKYNQTADHYDLRYSEIQNKKLKFLLNRVDSPGNNRNRLILDVGCGTSTIFDTLNDNLNGIFYYIGVDLSIEMLKIALRKNLKPASETGKNISLILADSGHLPLKEHLYDLVISLTVAQNLPKNEIMVFLKIIYMMMKNSHGKLLISFHKKIFSSKSILKCIKKISKGKYQYFDLKQIEDYLFIVENI